MTTQAQAARGSGGDELAAPLDFLLTAAANGPVKRFMPNSSWARLARRLAARPGIVARRATDLGGELVKVAIGRSVRAPSKRDRRFKDPAWTYNPFLRRALQAYLASAETAETLLADAELDWADQEKMRFVVTNAIDALAPSNNPFLSPDAMKALIDTAGLSVLAGLRNLVSDLATPPRVPRMVEPDAFKVGRTLAVTPGAVVLRTEVFELIQYTPRAEKVRAVPLLIVPPVINKYYVADLAPGRSLVEYYLTQGLQVFMISWRNPDGRHRDWTFDTYGKAIDEAMDGVQRICRTEHLHLLATCSGGILASMLLGHLADEGRLDRVVTYTLMVTMLDSARAGLASAFADERAASAAIAMSASRGYLDGRALAEVFAWLRPTDLIWTYWINNYLQGRPAPAFDVLYWNADTTRMAAGVHRDFVNSALTNALTKPGEAAMLGSRIDLGKVTVPSYVIAGIADHICPWQACYRSTQLLGGENKFVLSTAGHIASIVNPPDNPKATFQVNEHNPPDPAEWLKSATTVPGSWWPDHAAWLNERGGKLVAAPAELGGAGLNPMEPAPGTYVFDK
ncbi:MAG TPA: alpha/beta fold hydrolase [Kribbellaceae bacterium]